MAKRCTSASFAFRTLAFSVPIFFWTLCGAQFWAQRPSEHMHVRVFGAPVAERRFFFLVATLMGAE